MFATRLVCKGCGADYPLDARFACDQCFGPLEAAYDDDAIARSVTREQIVAGPSNAVAVRRLPAGRAAGRGLPVGISPLIAADRPRRGAGAASASCTSRPRRRTRPTRSRTGWSRSLPPRRSSWVRGAGLCLHRQPGRRHRGRRGGARLAVLHLRPRRSGAGEDPCRRGLRCDGVRRQRHLRRRQPAVLGARIRAPMGVCERQHAGLLLGGIQDDRAGDRRAARLAGPDRVVAPIASGSLYTKILAGFEQARAAGLTAPGARR